MNTALATIRSTMNLIERRYLGHIVMYENVNMPPGGVDALLATLQRGENAWVEERKKHGLL